MSLLRSRNRGTCPSLDAASGQEAMVSTGRSEE